MLTALFACDSNNRVILKAYDELKSRGMESRLSFADGKLDYRAGTPPDTVFLPAHDSIIHVPVEVKVEVNRLTWGQETWIRIGKALSALTVGLLVFMLAKKRLGK